MCEDSEPMAAELAASEERFRQMAENVREVFWLFDRREGRLLYVSPAYEAIWGRPVEKLYERLGDAAESIHPDDRAAAGESLARVAETGADTVREYRIIRPDGEIRWIADRTFPVRDANGQVYRIGGIAEDVTDRKRAEEAIRRSEERWRSLVEHAPVFIATVDRDGTILFLNRTAPGQSVDDSIGRTVYDYIPPRYHRRARAALGRVFKDGTSQGHDLAARGPDGVERWYSVRIGPIWGDGHVEAAVVIATDITQRRRARQALLESEARYRAVVSDQTEMITRYLPGSTILTFVNRACWRRFAASPGEMIGRPMTDFVPEEHRAAILEALSQLTPENPAFTAEHPVVERSGEVRWEQWTNRAIFDDEGRVVEHQGVGRDVTERRRADAALRLSELQYRSTVNALSDVLHVVDRDLRVLLHNTVAVEWCERLDLPDDILGRTVSEVFPFLPDRVWGEYERVFETGEALVTEETTEVGDRQVVTETRKIPVFEEGRVTRVITLVRDITEQRRLEEEMRHAERLESLGVLAGGIAHDFSNLLTGILGSLARARAESPEAGEGLAEAERAALRAQGITRQLLSLSTGGAPVKTVASIADLIIQTAQFALSGSNVRCRLEVPADLWPVEADLDQISQVVQNLVINADQAMPGGGVVEVRARNVAPDEPGPRHGTRRIEIVVADWGVGIPREHRGRLFDPYFTTKEAGSGLGLAVCHTVVQRHGGHIRVESEVGVGATFRVTLPASDREPPAPAEVASALPRRPGRVLLMDDEAVVRRAARWLLTHLGYRVACAEDGERAVVLYREAMEAGEPFEAVVLDLTVPGAMGGLECLQRLREIDPDVAAVVCSGYSTEPVLAEHRRHGFRGVVLKPYELEDLDAALQRLLADRDARRQPLD